MAAVILIFAICGLHSQGSSAETTVFVQTGKDLHLDVKKPVVLPEFSEFKWTFNNNVNVVRLFPNNKTRIIPHYEGRAEVSVQNHSLRLKNVQQADSGDYTAFITGDINQLVAEYKVKVQDPVSPVLLSVEVIVERDSVSNSTDSCNLTVTCSTKDSHINSTFTCDTQTCNQKEGEQPKVTTSGSSLHVYLFNDSIICNHTNQVSRTRHMKEIRPLCFPTAVGNGSPTIATWIWIPVVLFICFGLCIGIPLYKRKNCKNTVYEVPQDDNSARTPNQNTTEDASGLSPNSTYALVGFTGPVGSTETKNTTSPETIYAQVTKPPTKQKKNREDAFTGLNHDMYMMDADSAFTHMEAK